MLEFATYSTAPTIASAPSATVNVLLVPSSKFTVTVSPLLVILDMEVPSFTVDVVPSSYVIVKTPPLLLTEAMPLTVKESVVPSEKVKVSSSPLRVTLSIVTPVSAVPDTPEVSPEGSY